MYKFIYETDYQLEIINSKHSVNFIKAPRGVGTTTAFLSLVDNYSDATHFRSFYISGCYRSDFEKYPEKPRYVYNNISAMSDYDSSYKELFLVGLENKYVTVIVENTTVDDNLVEFLEEISNKECSLRVYLNMNTLEFASKKLIDRLANIRDNTTISTTLHDNPKVH